MLLFLFLQYCSFSCTHVQINKLRKIYVFTFNLAVSSSYLIHVYMYIMYICIIIIHSTSGLPAGAMYAFEKTALFKVLMTLQKHIYITAVHYMCPWNVLIIMLQLAGVC